MSLNHTLYPPGPADRVFKDECVLSFDTPFSPEGLYVNMRSFVGVGKKYLSWDAARSGGKVYLHMRFRQIDISAAVSKVESDTQAQEVTRLAIGVDGGFRADAASYLTEKEYAIVTVSNNGEPVSSIVFPDPSLSADVTSTAQGIIDHMGMRSKVETSTWDASNE